MRFVPKVVAAALVAVAAGFGCGSKPENKVEDNTATADMPVFSLAVSEYPSWSTFVVAKKAGLINGTGEGEPGTLEKKWGVRLRLEIKDYDPCLTMYGSGTVDAVCMTNIDALNPAKGRKSTVIMPTSTSVGGDKIIGVGFTQQRGDEEPKKASVDRFLKANKTYGLSKSVSEFVWYRGLEKLGLNPKDYQFVNLEPAAAATALQTGSKDVKAVCIWNPYALQTLRQQKAATVLFDSSIIPEEVIDAVVMGNDSLAKPGGDKAAALICDTFYEVCKRMDNAKTADVTIKALGEEFSNLGIDDMKLVCKETRFYSTPQAGIKLFDDKTFQTATMPTVLKAAQGIGLLDAAEGPGGMKTFGFADERASLNFTTTYMQRVAAKQ